MNIFSNVILCREGTASTLCVSYMVKHKGMPLDHALNKIKTNRPEIKPCTSYCLQLQEYEQYVIEQRRYNNSKFGCFSAILNGKYFGERHDILEKISHNWIQLTIYFLIIVFLFRFAVQLLMIMFIDEDDADERNRLPCA